MLVKFCVWDIEDGEGEDSIYSDVCSGHGGESIMVSTFWMLLFLVVLLNAVCGSGCHSESVRVVVRIMVLTFGCYFFWRWCLAWL